MLNGVALPMQRNQAAWVVRPGVLELTVRAADGRSSPSVSSSTSAARSLEWVVVCYGPCRFLQRVNHVSDRPPY
ncbi:MAG: hypothetical protein RJA70_1103 [Pseudomonadota bacterium]|jgi:hypothetical protein